LKLLEKYNRLNITATILIFIIGSCCFYFLLNYILVRELDEELRSEQQEIVAYVNLHQTLPEIIPTKNEYTFYEPVSSEQKTINLSGKNKYGGEQEEFREIHFTVAAQGRIYLVKVAIPTETTEALLQAIIGITIVMIGLILLAGYLINRTVIRKLWQPFYQTIEKVRSYHVTDPNIPALEKGDIEEFTLLNQSINDMIARVQHDYTALKNFTGQAAHEMQTPIAVIRLKLDMLIQNEDLLQKNATAITDIEKSVQRISRLHQSLLLLTKVENKQFLMNEQVEMDKIVIEKCAEYSDLAESMGIAIMTTLTPTTIQFHAHLADILINNIISNAIKYNKPGGAVNVILHNNTLSIINPSNTGSLDLEKVFKPFYRNGNSQEGTGLGLSIAKQICETAGYSIRYEYSNARHVFSITFS
jgi:signal transduction histidine kinase